MINLSQNDLTARVQLLQCCIGELASVLLSKIKIGSKDINCKLQELQVLQEMLDAVKCYKVLSSTVTEVDNCLTEQQVQDIFDYMSKKCNECFQFPEYIYN